MAATSANLSDVVKSFKDEASQIEAVLLTSSGNTDVSSHILDYHPSDDGCIVSLWDAWNRFMRALLLSCASMEVTGLSGASYKPQLTLTESGATSLLAAAARSRSNSIRQMAGEPAWYDQVGLLDMTTELKLTNGQQIVSAVTSSLVHLNAGFSAQNPIEEIRTIRNFIAHKGDSTLIRARGYMRGDVTSHLRDSMLGGVIRFGQWVDCLGAIAESAAN